METLVLSALPPLRGRVRLPGSKSLSNRALLLASVARGETTLVGLLESEDTAVCRAALRQLGVVVRETTDGCTVVEGRGGRLPLWMVPEEPLDMGNAGTVMRPLAALLLAGRGEFVLDGVERMRERPIGDLVDALRPLLPPGGAVDYLGKEGFPPLRIRSAGLRGGETEISGTVSSQFLTGVLMAAPLADGPLVIRLRDELPSRPYVDMTVGLLGRFGVTVGRPDSRTWEIHPTVPVSPGRLAIEGDASSASYFLAFGALAGPVRVEGCGRESVQGDVRFADALEAMGARVTWGADWIEASAPPDGIRLRGMEHDCSAIPDAAMTLATLALFAQGPTTLRGIGSWRVKETERVVAVRDELRKLGATVEEGSDWLRIHPPERLIPARIATYRDHRMAMAFSIAAHGVEVEIEDPACTSKTFPGYFEELSRLRDTSVHVSDPPVKPSASRGFRRRSLRAASLALVVSGFAWLGMHTASASNGRVNDEPVAPVCDTVYAVPGDVPDTVWVEPGLQTLADSLLVSRPRTLVVVVGADLRTGGLLFVASARDGRLETTLRSALQPDYPAASVAKVVTARAALEAGILPETRFGFWGASNTLNRFQVGARRASDTVSFLVAFARSNNPVFADLGLSLGDSVLREQAGRLGFDRDSGLGKGIPSGRWGRSDTDFELGQAASGFTRRHFLSPVHAAILARSLSLGTQPEPIRWTPVRRDAGCPEPPVDPLNASMRALMTRVVDSGTARPWFDTSWARYRRAHLEIGGKTGSLNGNNPPGRHEWFAGTARVRGTDSGIALGILVVAPRRESLPPGWLASSLIEAWDRRRTVGLGRIPLDSVRHFQNALDSMDRLAVDDTLFPSS